MKILNRSYRNLLRHAGLPIALFAFIPILAMSGFASRLLGQQAMQQTFASPAEATETLFQAVKSGDAARIANVLGGTTELLSTNDEVQDDIDRGLFVEKYQEMHRLARDADGLVTLYIGAENWSFPVPLVEKAGSWRFDVAKGQDEVLLRRMGENELTAIATCREFVAAERQYQANPDTPNLDSSSPSSLVAKAATGSGSGDPVLLQGYYFRLLPGQKPARGFTLIAYPVQYRSSGVMTFVVTESGVVYEKDLGPETSTIASSMTTFNRDRTWRPAQE